MTRTHYIVRLNVVLQSEPRHAPRATPSLIVSQNASRCKRLIETSTSAFAPIYSPNLLALCSYVLILSLYSSYIPSVVSCSFHPSSHRRAVSAETSRDARVSINSFSPIREAHSWYLSMRTVSILPSKSTPFSSRIAFMASVLVAYRTVP